MIKAVVFDLDDTLYDQYEYLTSAFRESAHYLSARLNFSENYLLEKLLEISRTRGSDSGKIIDELIQCLGVNVSVKELADGAVNSFLSYRPAKIKTYSGVRNVLEGLKANNFKIGVLTDGQSKIQVSKLQALSVFHYFDTLNRDPGFAIYLEAGKAVGLPLYVAGSIVVIKREVFNKIGLFNKDSVAEDTDLSTRMYLNGFEVTSESRAFSLEEAVNNFNGIRKRTYRWSRGHDRVFFDYWKKVLRSDLPKMRKIYLEIYLAFYLIPVLTFFCIIIYISSFTLNLPVRAFFINWEPVPWLIFSVFYFLYCFLSIPTFYWAGIKLTGRRLRDISVFLFDILFAFVNIWVCTRAFFDVLFRREYLWVKTPRSKTFYLKEDENLKMNENK